MQRLALAVATDLQADGVAGLTLLHHLNQFIGAIYALTIDADDFIARFEPSLFGGAAAMNARDQHALLPAVTQGHTQTSLAAPLLNSQLLLTVLLAAILLVVLPTGLLVGILAPLLAVLRALRPLLPGLLIVLALPILLVGLILPAIAAISSGVALVVILGLDCAAQHESSHCD